MQVQIKQINKQGQISIGKKHAGQKVQVEEYPDGSVILTPVEIISKSELKLMKDQLFRQRIESFGQWESDNPPSETDVKALEKRLED